jgi:hypothetical protein
MASILSNKVVITHHVHRLRCGVLSKYIDNVKFRAELSWLLQSKDQDSIHDKWVTYFEPLFAQLARELAETVDDTPERIVYELSTLRCGLNICCYLKGDHGYIWERFFGSIATDRV